MRLAVFYGDAWVFAVLVLKVSIWKHMTGAINTCVAFIEGAQTGVVTINRRPVNRSHFI